MNRRRVLVLHPFLFALFPVLSLYSHNIEQTAFSEALVPLAFAAGLAVVLLLLSRVLLADYPRAGILSSMTLGLFFSYGHVYMWLRGIWPDRYVVTGFVLLIVCIAAIVVCAVMLRRAPRAPVVLTGVLNIIATALVVVALVGVAAYEVRAGRSQPGHGNGITPGAPRPDTGQTSPRPDIYYIVMDRYPSARTLGEIYGYDNSAFLEYLVGRGFHIPPESRCNYARTDMSLASSLNMEYLDQLVEGVEPAALARVLHARAQDYELWRFLKSRGYKFIHFGTQWRTTSRNAYADCNYNRLLLTDFSMMVYKTTMLYPVGAALGFDVQREQWRRVLYNLDRLSEMPDDAAPTFVFAHFLLPHEPYVFGSDGRFQTRFDQMRAGTKKGFVEQVAFANDRLRVLIDALLSRSGVPPIIVLQADEGPHPPENFEDRDSLTTLRARFNILNAMYLPGLDPAVLSSRMTPVNTFRVILNHYFGATYEILPDRSFDFRDARFVDVTDIVGWDQ